jgi:hypothetical protein
MGRQGQNLQAEDDVVFRHRFLIESPGRSPGLLVFGAPRGGCLVAFVTALHQQVAPPDLQRSNVTFFRSAVPRKRTKDLMNSDVHHS